MQGTFDNSPGAESLAGFGFEHDGVKSGLAQAHSGPRFEAIQDDETVISNLRAFLLAFDTGTPPATGWSLTLTPESLSDADILTEWSRLERQARSGRVDLTVKGPFGGLAFGRAAGSTEYLADPAQGLARSRIWIEDQVRSGAVVTLMGVPPGSGLRMGIDRDSDGVPDGGRPEIRLSTHAGEDEIRLGWKGDPGQAYQIEGSETLNPGSWMEVGRNVADQTGAASWAAALERNKKTMFFRVRSDP